MLPKNSVTFKCAPYIEVNLSFTTLLYSSYKYYVTILRILHYLT